MAATAVSSSQTIAIARFSGAKEGPVRRRPPDRKPFVSSPPAGERPPSRRKPGGFALGPQQPRKMRPASPGKAGSEPVARRRRSLTSMSAASSIRIQPDRSICQKARPATALQSSPGKIAGQPRASLKPGKARARNDWRLRPFLTWLVVTAALSEAVSLSFPCRREGRSSGSPLRSAPA